MYPHPFRNYRYCRSTVGKEPFNFLFVRSISLFLDPVGENTGFFQDGRGMPFGGDLRDKTWDLRLSKVYKVCPEEFGEVHVNPSSRHLSTFDVTDEKVYKVRSATADKFYQVQSLPQGIPGGYLNASSRHLSTFDVTTPKYQLKPLTT